MYVVIGFGVPPHPPEPLFPSPESTPWGRDRGPPAIPKHFRIDQHRRTTNKSQKWIERSSFLIYSLVSHHFAEEDQNMALGTKGNFEFNPQPADRSWGPLG